jgi:hypothetical protein
VRSEAAPAETLQIWLPVSTASDSTITLQEWARQVGAMS